MDLIQNALCDLLRSALWDIPNNPISGIPWEDVFREARQQTVAALFLDHLPDYPIPEAVRKKWTDDCLQQYAVNLRILDEQAALRKILDDAGIPFLVLKGSAASVYYPDPMLRSMGDIDLFAAKSRIGEIRDLMDINGYHRVDNGKDQQREDQYARNQNIIEIHDTVGNLNTREAEELLSSWFREELGNGTEGQMEGYAFPMLPATKNGLMLLAHINHHLEGGLGLRQIIDWMMYVYRELGDREWPEFREKAEQLGLVRLAVTVTRMCQRHLGLTENIHWCLEADDALCDELMDYVLACGNFGKKQGEHNTAAMVLSHGHGLTGFFRNLQKRGEVNWDLLRRHKRLKAFAWVYQGFRYAGKAFGRKNALRKLRNEYAESRRRFELLERLEATRLAEKK